MAASQTASVAEETVKVFSGREARKCLLLMFGNIHVGCG